jgi:hypothetical protein
MHPTFIDAHWEIDTCNFILCAVENIPYAQGLSEYNALYYIFLASNINT